MGMKPLGLNDRLATPMYDVFSPTPVNSAPVNNLPTKVDLLKRNTPRRPVRGGVEPAAARDAGPAPPGRAGQHHLAIGLRRRQHATTARTERRQ